MVNLDKLIENLVRIDETGRPVSDQTILTALIQIANAVKELKERHNGDKN
jgi:hypothetical protein